MARVLEFENQSWPCQLPKTNVDLGINPEDRNSGAVIQSQNVDTPRFDARTKAQLNQPTVVKRTLQLNLLVQRHGLDGMCEMHALHVLPLLI